MEQALPEMVIRLQTYQLLLVDGVLQQHGGPGHIPHFNQFSGEAPLGKSEVSFDQGSSSLRVYRRVKGRPSNWRQLPGPFGELQLIQYGTWDQEPQSLTFCQN